MSRQREYSIGKRAGIKQERNRREESISRQPRTAGGKFTSRFEWKIRRWSWTVVIAGIFLVMGMIIGGVWL